MIASSPLARPGALYLAAGLTALCGIVYELLIGAASSYLLGDGVRQFSLTIGLYLSAMGLGSYLSQHVTRRPFAAFLAAELVVALMGGFSGLVLFWGFGSSPEYYPWLQYGLTLVVGALVGLEIPLLLRLLEGGRDLRENAATVLGLDYAGGLVGSLAFPLLLLPMLGLVRTALCVGLANVAIVALGLWRYAPALHVSRRDFGLAVAACALLLGGALAHASSAESYLEQRLYRDAVLVSAQTRYQHLTLTRNGSDLRLFINGNLQYSALDEYRYHEALVHVPIARMAAPPREALILGGGDGLAARELLKYPQVRRIDLVDLDPEMTHLHATRPELVALNAGALGDPRVHIHNLDAFQFLAGDRNRYDLAIVDLPDPNSEPLVKLFTREFYRLAGEHLRSHGAMVIQASSPYFSRQAYWCVAKTVGAAGFVVQTYHLDVPSFGDWGFVLASPHPLPNPPWKIPVATRYLTASLAPGLFVFGADEDRKGAPPSEINRLLKPVLLGYYEHGWGTDR